MAVSIPRLFTPPQTSCFMIIHSNLSSSFLSPPSINTNSRTRAPFFHCSYRRRRLYGDEEEEEETTQSKSRTTQSQWDDDDDDCIFNEAVELFNNRDYYKCHDFLEHLWIESPNDSLRTLFQSLLQCSVGFHHLFNHNHRGAMLELGEGLCKLRNFNFQHGAPFLQFELQISASLDFLYQTQLELAACSDDICLAMDQTERSYQLLGGYAAGQPLYSLATAGPNDDDRSAMYILFCPPERHNSNSSNGSRVDPPRVKLPTLDATQQHLTAYYDS